jgi:ParB/RepB/Spo0J family partition protein
VRHRHGEAPGTDRAVAGGRKVDAFGQRSPSSSLKTNPNPQQAKARIADIKVGVRHRKDLGDIPSLAATIGELGLLHPIVVRPDGTLIAGERRLEACKLLGWQHVPVTVVDLNEIVRGEFAENAYRQDFLPSEIDAIRRTLEPIERAAATSRKFSGRSTPDGGETRNKIAAFVGVSGRQVEKIAAVIERGAPELIRAVDADKVSVSAAADIATLPIEKQREIVANADPKIVLARAKQVRTEQAGVRRAERDRRLNEISKGNSDLPTDRRYPVIYADPAWQYEHPPMGGNRIPENHYPTMTLDQICGLPICKLATDDAMLFLWVPSPILESALRVMSAWGFAYRTCAVWVKDRHGMGFYFRQQHEILLVGNRGNPIVPDLSSSIIHAPRGKHSAKPVEVYEIIERMYPDLPKIELFARGKRKGWAAWGNQAEAAT